MNETARIILIAGLWLLWCAMHSLLISRRVVDRLQLRLGVRYAYYRLFFVLFSAVTVTPLLLYQFFVPQRLLFGWDGFWRLPQAILLCYALFMFGAGARNYDLRYFLGLRQIESLRRGAAPADPLFAVHGISAYVRHPWYSGGIALVWSAGPVTTMSLAVKIILTGYLLTGTVLEERKLVAAIGAPYRAYQKTVPMLIPRPRRG